MKRTIIFGMMLVFFCANLLAQDLPMLSSKDALRTYALEQSVNAVASINTSIPVGNYSHGFIQVESPTVEGISNTIRHMNLSVNIANPKDSIYVWTGVYNSDGDPLFTGENKFKLKNVNAKYFLPSNYGDITMSLYEEIPIRIEGVQSAQLTIQHSNGETQFGTSLRVSNGKVYFPRQFAGKNAILSVLAEGKNGGELVWLYWNVSNGSSIKPEHFAINLKTTIQGIVSVTDNNVMVSVPTTNRIGQNLTAELKVTENRNVLSSFWTTEDKWFKGAWVRKAGTSHWQYYPGVLYRDAGLIGFMLNVQTGIYYIIPVWNDGDLIEPADPWHSLYDEGKG